MKNKTVTILLIVILILVITSCGLENKSSLADQDALSRDSLLDEENAGNENKQDNHPTNEEEQKSDSDDTSKYQDENQDQTGSSMITDSGRYGGRSDNNFIEIKISAVPEEIASREFMLSEELKENLDNLSLQINDQIKFNYYENENKQKVIVEIEKL